MNNETIRAKILAIKDEMQKKREPTHYEKEIVEDIAQKLIKKMVHHEKINGELKSDVYLSQIFDRRGVGMIGVDHTIIIHLLKQKFVDAQIIGEIFVINDPSPKRCLHISCILPPAPEPEPAPAAPAPVPVYESWLKPIQVQEGTTGINAFCEPDIEKITSFFLRDVETDE